MYMFEVCNFYLKNKIYSLKGFEKMLKKIIVNKTKQKKTSKMIKYF